MTPTTRIRFHGVAAYEMVTSEGLHVLCDPLSSTTIPAHSPNRTISTRSISPWSIMPLMIILAAPG